MSAKSPHGEAARELRKLGLTSTEIGKQLGISGRKVRGLWRTPEQRKVEMQRRLERQRTRRRLRPRPRDEGQGWVFLKDWHDPRDIPEEVLADRERRIEAELTPNMAVLGDPLPGCSALDKMR